MVQETSEPGTTDSEPLPFADENGPATDVLLAEKPVRRVPLDRLLSVVVLSPAQASLVASQLLDLTHVHGSVEGAPLADRWAVTVTSAGELDVRPAQAGDGSRVTDLLERLSLNARRLPAHPRSDQLMLVRRLEEAVVDPQLELGTPARDLERTLAEVLGPGARERLTAQLAALVEAFDRIAPSVEVSVDALSAPGRPRPDSRRAAQASSARSRPPRRGKALRRRRTRTRRMALVVLVLAAVAGAGYYVLQGPGIGSAGARNGGDRPAAPDSTAPAGHTKHPAQQAGSHPRHGVAALAARHSGPVTGVALQKTGSCTAGALCPVKVTVRFRPASTTRAVTWRVGTTPRCGSRVTWSAPVSVSAQPGWTSVYASSSVTVPRGSSRTLVALTSAPARAQSPPVPVTGSGQAC